MTRRLLKERGYSLQANAKTIEGNQHPDRDAQFAYLNDQVAAPPGYRGSGDQRRHQEEGAGRGRTRTAAGNGGPPASRSGSRSMTSSTAPRQGQPVRGVRRGYEHRVGVGGHRPRHRCIRGEHHRDLVAERREDIAPEASRLLICADGGGSNGYRTRQWKTELAELAATTGLTITVCHLPPGTSKWNKIEHRLFSHISMNWRGRPLTSHEVIVETIAATTTSTGLTVHAELDQNLYPTGSKSPTRT